MYFLVLDIDDVGAGCVDDNRAAVHGLVERPRYQQVCLEQLQAVCCARQGCQVLGAFQVAWIPAGPVHRVATGQQALDNGTSHVACNSTMGAFC